MKKDKPRLKLEDFYLDFSISEKYQKPFFKGRGGVKKTAPELIKYLWDQGWIDMKILNKYELDDKRKRREISKPRI